MAIPIKRLSLAIFFVLLVLDTEWPLMSRAARILDENHPSHGHENDKINAGGSHPRPDGSHVPAMSGSGSHENDKSGVGESHTRKASASPHYNQVDPADHFNQLETTAISQKEQSYIPNPPPAVIVSDPLEAYHFNCTLCDSLPPSGG